MHKETDIIDFHANMTALAKQIGSAYKPSESLALPNAEAEPKIFFAATIEEAALMAVALRLGTSDKCGTGNEEKTPHHKELEMAHDSVDAIQKKEVHHKDLEAIEGIPVRVFAPELLMEAANCIGNRAVERDVDQERSMKSCIASFNAMFDKDLTEEQGWHLMTLLKISRSKGGNFRLDDYIDGAAYQALAGEAAAMERG